MGPRLVAGSGARFAVSCRQRTDLRGRVQVSSQVVLSATVAEEFGEHDHTTAFAATSIFRELSNALFYLAGPFFAIEVPPRARPPADACRTLEVYGCRAPPPRSCLGGSTG